MTGPGPVESAGGGWTTETILAHLTAVIDQVEKRVISKIESNDERYQQRFLDGQNAVAAALSAAKEAGDKAETASDKRFDGVNEFRAALGDQQRMLMPRLEAEQRFASLENKVDAAVKTLQEAITLNTKQVAEIQARGVGAKDQSAERRANVADQRLVAGLVISVIVAVIAIIGFVLKLSSGGP